MKLTANELLKRGFRKGPNGAWYKPSNLAPRVSHPVAELDAREAVVCPEKAENRSQKRLVVRVTCFRTRLLDADNNSGGQKYLVDQLRYFELIPDDDPGSILLIPDQKKVSTKDEEGTLIEIFPEVLPS